MDFKSAINDLISILTSLELQRELFPVKVVFIFFTIAFFVLIIYFLATSSYFKWNVFIDVKEFFHLESAYLRRISREWKKIRKKVEAGTDSDYRLAILAAEDLFNDILTEKGFKEESFEEKLKKVQKDQVPNVAEILEVHKMRNRIVYNPDYTLTKEETERILEVYERGIKSLESF